MVARSKQVSQCISFDWVLCGVATEAQTVLEDWEEPSRVILLEKSIFDSKWLDLADLGDLGSIQIVHFIILKESCRRLYGRILCLVLSAVQSSDLELAVAFLTVALHRLVCSTLNGTFFIVFLRDLRKALNSVRLHRYFSLALFDVEKDFLAVFDGILATLEACNFRNMPQLASPSTIHRVVHELVGVDNLDHFFFRIVFEWVVLSDHNWVELRLEGQYFLLVLAQVVQIGAILTQA